MNLFLEKEQSYQPTFDIMQRLDLRSPELNYKNFSLPETQCKFSIQSSNEDQSYGQEQNGNATRSFIQTNQLQYSKAVEVQNDMFIMQLLDPISKYYKSCQLEQKGFQIVEQIQFTASKSSEIKPGAKIFQEQQRKDKLARYLKKKPQRNYGKIIRYPCRKSVAEDRIRKGGKFQKHEEMQQVKKIKKESSQKIILECKKNHQSKKSSMLTYQKIREFRQKQFLSNELIKI